MVRKRIATVLGILIPVLGCAETAGQGGDAHVTDDEFAGDGEIGEEDFADIPDAPDVADADEDGGSEEVDGIEEADAEFEEVGDDGPDAETGGLLGDPCTRHADCVSRYCVETPEGDHVCSGPCTAGACPSPWEDWECRSMRAGSTSVVFLCLPPNDLLCAACFRDDQCGGLENLCIDYPIGSFCGRYCAIEECPFGYDCIDMEVGGVTYRECYAASGNCADCFDRDGDLRGAGDDCMGPDCNDDDPNVYDDSDERVDRVDNDCDGLTDEGTVAYDDDGDGFCQTDPCTVGDLGGGDCDDSAAAVYPSAPEDGGGGTSLADGVDNDCDGATDEGTLNYDDDLDGYCEADPCVFGIFGGGDCDDALNTRHPGAAEIPNGVDDDCDGTTDEATSAYDDDGDGFCEIAPCLNAPAGGDCNDADTRIYPGAPEDGGTGTGAPDRLDNDCDGTTDEATTGYDDDGDGFCEVGPCLGPGVLPGDCADANPARNPGRLEVCGNGVDDDCDGTTDVVDNDGDGAVDAACGGTDCDDADPGVRPGASEIRDAKDNNCDGSFDEGLIAVGDIVITEIMKDPTGTVTDANGEWVEVRNVSIYPINLQGWVLRDDGTDMHTISRAGTGVRVEPGGVAVLVRNADTGLNGGVAGDYAYGNFQLGNAGDEVVLVFGGVEIDRVNYLDGPAWPDPTGASLNLTAPSTTAAANDNVANWCVTPLGFNYHPENRGTPGAVNVDCAGGPAVGRVDPRRGISAGGETVLVGGNRLTGATSVAFGGVAAGFTVLDDRTIRATTPAGSPGRVDVAVVTPGGSFVLAGGFTYTGTASTLDFCNVQFPESTTTSSGTPTVIILGRVREAGVTPPAGQGVGILGELGWGPAATDPRTTPRWVWIAAAYYLDVGTDDSYGASIVPSPAGTYSYAYRFSSDGGVQWLYCDVGVGTSDGFSIANLGVLTVL